MAPLIWGLLALGGGYAGYKLFGGPKTFGEMAQVGDTVQVPLAAFTAINAGMGLPVVPPNTATVSVKVTVASKDNVAGPIVAFGAVNLPGTVLPSSAPSSGFIVPRNAITMIIRNGKTATPSSAGFHGDLKGRVFQG